MILGEKIRELRLAHGLSQTELAEMVGVKQSIIADIEKGKQRRSRALPRFAGEWKRRISVP